MKILSIAPHPDDETLGCGGTLIRHLNEGDDIFWMIVTTMEGVEEWSDDERENRKSIIKLVAEEYNFSQVFNCGFPSTRLDTIPMNDIVKKISNYLKIVKPDIIYLPFLNDVHTDHQIIAKAVQSSIKWFRHNYIEKVLMYETLSETDFNFSGKKNFNPNTFINISDYLEKKINIMKLFESEIGTHPFPRSEKAIRSLAAIRGSQSGYLAAEAFELIYYRK